VYLNLVIFAVFILIYSTVAGAVERTWISGAIIFTAFGLLMARSESLGIEKAVHREGNGIETG